MEAFFRNKLTQAFEVDELITVHYFKYAKNFCMDGETHDFYELVYVDSGKVKIANGSEKLVLGSGEAFIHRPNVFHSIKADETLCNIFVLTFDGIDLERLELYDRILAVPKAAKECIAQIVALAARTFNEPLDIVELKKMTLNEEPEEFAALQLLRVIIERLLITLCQNIKRSDPKIENRSALYNDIVLYLEKNIDKVLSLKKISDKMGYSISYIKKVFHQYNDAGILQHHLKMKIEYAKRLISENAYTFVEISEMLGFSSPQYFSAAFRKHTNMSPKEYLNSVNVTHLL